MDPDTQAQREAFYRDLAHLPPERVEALVDTVPFLTPTERRDMKYTAQRLVRERRAGVLKIIDQEFRSIGDRVDRAEEEADQINDELDQLIEDTEAGLVELDDFRRRYRQLEHRVGNVERNVGLTSKSVETLRVKEEDPEGWLQSMERKYPRIKDGVMGRYSPPTVGPEGPTQWQRREFR